MEEFEEVVHVHSDNPKISHCPSKTIYGARMDEN